MAVERTFAIIKPDAVKKKVAGQILSRIEESGLEIIAMKWISLPTALANGDKTCVDCHKGIAHKLPDMSEVEGWQ